MRDVPSRKWKRARAKQIRWTYTTESAEKRMNMSEITDRKYTIAFIPTAFHLDVVKAPFLNLFYHDVGLHQPCQNRVEGENDLVHRAQQRRARTPSQ
jgi:hypothetical protein